MTRAGLNDADGTLRTLEAEISALKAAVAKAEDAALLHGVQAGELLKKEQFADRLRKEWGALVREAAKRRLAHDTAVEALGVDEETILARYDKLQGDVAHAWEALEKVDGWQRDHIKDLVRAQAAVEGAEKECADAQEEREAALRAWWVPVGAGLGDGRVLPDVSGQLITHAITQAQWIRREVNPARWAELVDADAKRKRVESDWRAASTTRFMALSGVLESNGGRSASIDDDTGELPAVLILVDGHGTLLSPPRAATRLLEQLEELTRNHDDKLNDVVADLLSSTFLDHLCARLSDVVTLLTQVNTVLAEHPTGANRTTLRLVRVPADDQQSAFEVLKSLENDFLDSPTVQHQVRVFLEQRIHRAQEEGRVAGGEWKDHLAALLDYRAWFDVITEYRVHGDTRWRPLTKESHAKDSGGGKVVTLLQPLLATLVALYGESGTSPRMLWLDEAFEGVDPGNRTVMLDLLRDFELDFLLVGPTPLVTSASVDVASVWYVTRAPALIPGVDLSVMLWAGNKLQAVRMAEPSWQEELNVARTSQVADDSAGAPEEDLFTAIEGQS